MVSARALSTRKASPSQTKSRQVVFIAGPTASGKTELGMALADYIASGKLSGFDRVSLINVDAAQVYRGMNIGTAKLKAEQLAQYPHALIDILDPLEVYDAAQFVHDATVLIEQAHAQNSLPVLVGGSLFYFSALEKGVSKLPAADESIRQQLNAEAETLGWNALYARLQVIDPVLCQNIKEGDKQRIQRALEIHLLCDAVPSEVMKKSAGQPLQAQLFKFNLFTPDRKLLHQRIGQRFKAMLEKGLIAEVKGLKDRGDLHLDLPSMRCVGYRQTWQYLAGEIDQAMLLEQGCAATRQLAKRQLTWLRHQRGQIWLSSENKNNVALMRPFLEQAN